MKRTWIIPPVIALLILVFGGINLILADDPVIDNLFDLGMVQGGAKDSPAYEYLGDYVAIATEIEFEPIEVNPKPKIQRRTSDYDRATTTEEDDDTEYIYKLVVYIDLFDSVSGDFFGQYTYITPADYPEECKRALEEANVKNVLIMNPWYFAGPPSESREYHYQYNHSILPLVFMYPDDYTGVFNGQSMDIPLCECFDTIYFQVD
jgi:hypothetical protein